MRDGERSVCGHSPRLEVGDLGTHLSPLHCWLLVLTHGDCCPLCTIIPGDPQEWHRDPQGSQNSSREEGDQSASSRHLTLGARKSGKALGLGAGGRGAR